MNTVNFFILLKPLPSLSTLSTTKHFHLASPSQADSDQKSPDHKDKTKAERKAKLNKLANFSFVQLNKPIERPNEATAAPKINEPPKQEEIKQQQTYTDTPKNLYTSQQTPNKETNEKLTKTKDFLDQLKQSSKAKQQRISPKAVSRLARLIDPDNTEKTAEILTEPIEKVRSPKPDVFDLR